MPGEFPVNRLFALLEVWDVIPVGDRRGRSRRRTKKKVNDRLERGGECELNCVKEGTTTCTVNVRFFADGGDDRLLGSLLLLGRIIK